MLVVEGGWGIGSSIIDYPKNVYTWRAQIDAT